MEIQVAFDAIAEGGIIAGTRGSFPPDVAVDVCGTLYDEGIRVFEFTMNSQQPIEAMNAVQTELGGGSIRIHTSDVQRTVFKALGIDDQEAQEKFGFL